MKFDASRFWLWIALAFCSVSARAADAYAYMDEADPFYPHRDFPKLVTPQWVGEPGVDAVVILAIDDMRAPDRYEAFLRPILDRLKRIDGRAPVSIYCNALDPNTPQLAQWLEEGLSLEVHTLSHPCPLLAKGDWQGAWETYHGCVDLLNQIPGNKPVAFRMPCCDSMNSPSPRFFAEMFGRTSAAGNHLTIDSSVMNLITTNDSALPRELVLDADGTTSRFAKYLPAQPGGNIRVGMGSFVTTIEDYPYPYVIGGVCWEFPAMVPSDWEAQNLHGTNNPVTVQDWLAGLDVAVRKRGVFPFIFHPHGWIRAEQMVEFIDRAVARHGQRVKFLTFKEAAERLKRHLLLNHALRSPAGHDHGVRLLDLNDDGYLDVLAGAGETRWTRVWNPGSQGWTQTDLPVAFRGASDGADLGARFGRVDGAPVLLVRNEEQAGGWRFQDGQWRSEPRLLEGLEFGGQPLFTSRGGRDLGVRFRDVTGDGQSELLVLNATHRQVWTWRSGSGRWAPLSCALPEDVRLVDDAGRDGGLRFVDVNADGHDDLVFSDPVRYSVDLFVAQPRENLGFVYGWSFRVREGARTDPHALPMISRGGAAPNNGAWFRRGHMWVQNEDTAHLPDKVDRRALRDLIRFDVPAPRTPEESLRSMVLQEGYVMELVTAEPLVQDPVAFEWDADGRLWVVEMSDYPSGAQGEGGRVRVLHDTDGDGRYDRGEVFLDGLNFPTGVMPWREGVLVSAAPEIFYAEDRDGDGRADVRITLMEGFGEGNQQHRVNGFELGLDNWVYAANGDSGGQIRVVGRVPAGPADTRPFAPKKGFQLRGRDLRFRPEEGLAEPVAGQTQFGRRRDDWGNWFGNNNPNWGWHYWIEERYLARNPDLPVRSALQHLPDYDNKNRVFAISEEVVRFNWPGGFNQVTSANSPTPYRDDLPGLANSLFISEPANNVIHREILEPRGVSFRSQRAPSEQQSEFVASRDAWFRPTMLKTGPDGALYAADMYRLVIEHPEYALPGIERSIDVRAGSGQGRIYRIYPKHSALRAFQPLHERTSDALASALDSGNGWIRDTAHRLLLHRADPAAVPPLRIVARQGTDPRGRLHALCVLEGLGQLDPGTVLSALKDIHPVMREHAVRVSEEWLRRNEHPEVLDALLSLAADPSTRVRFQLALSLGETRDARAAPVLLGLLVRDGEDSQMRTAGLSSSGAHAGNMLEAALTGGESAKPWIEPLTVLATANSQQEAVNRALDQLSRPSRAGGFAAWQFDGLASFLQSWRRQGGTLQTLAQHWKQAPAKLDGLFEHARRLAAEPAEEATRLAAIGLLGQGVHAEDLAVLGKLLGANQPPNLESAAVAALAHRMEPGVAEALLASWPGLGPARRVEVLNALLSRETWTLTFLDRVGSGAIPANQVGADTRQRLFNQPVVRARAEQIFGGVDPRRTQLLERYAEVTRLAPAPERGAPLFSQHCATCHRLGEEGVGLGPDLAAITDASVPALLVSILDPNRSVEPAYVNYAARLKDGRQLEGLIAAETANSIALRGAGGIETLILRRDLVELRSLGLSLMPEGLEHALDAQQMADLIGYVRGYVRGPASAADRK